LDFEFLGEWLSDIMSHIASALDKFQGENSKSQTVIIAAVTHPFIKLRWLSNPEMKKVAEGLFLRKLHKIEPMQDEASPSAK